MRVRVRDDLADALIHEVSSTLRHASASEDKAAPGWAAHTPETGAPSLKGHFPSTWSTGSNIQLMPPKLSDTTDRSLFRRARLAAFDAHGYRHRRGLQRPLFYKSGYLSCTKCNGLTFIDASALRTVLELNGVVDVGKARPESLPPCAGCCETSGLKVGAHDFLILIEGGKEALARRRRLERVASKTIQRAFRRHLHIQWRKAEIVRQRTIVLLRYRSAQVIQAILRGRLGRRVFETEKWLREVKKAHRLLIKHALDHYPSRKRVFWYKNEAEEDQLYADYRMLVKRTGFRPPRTIVEQNIREIGERVSRTFRCASLSEGGGARRAYPSAVEGTECSALLDCLPERAEEASRGARQHGSYVTERSATCDDSSYTDGKARLRRAYITERQEELTARLMGHSNPKLADGLKMKAFFESPYGDDVVSGLMNDQVWRVCRREKYMETKGLERKQRAEWVRLKQLEDPQLAMYFREEVTARNVYVIDKLRLGHRPTKNVASILRAINGTDGRKFDFPKHVRTTRS
ncbi:unnamed protein product, partial [Scytosiphon promiscuus]